MRTAAHAVQCAFDAIGNGGNFHPRIGAKDSDGFGALFRRDGHYGVEHERGDERTVLAAAETDEPGTRVVHVEFLQRITDVLESHSGH